jgi:hypothetical protein
METVALSSVVRLPKAMGAFFQPPKIFYTLKGNPRSEAVIEQLRILLEEGEIPAPEGWRCEVVEDPTQVTSLVNGDHDQSVVIFDHGTRKMFHATCLFRQNSSIPTWANSFWGVHVGPRCGESRALNCAEEVRGWFVKNFLKQVRNKDFPWGTPRNQDPELVVFDTEAAESILEKLNNGPNLAASIVNERHAAEIPAGQMISWIRVPGEPVGFSEEYLLSVMGAFESFERACKAMLSNDGFSEEVAQQVMAGVVIDPELEELYLHPASDSFTASRIDLHWTKEKGFFASENDEMPGGLPELLLLDQAYGINQDRWEYFLGRLTELGPVMFLVSSEWSKCYHEDTRWLSARLNEMGYDTSFVTVEDFEANAEIFEEGLFWKGTKVGTVWRQFPIFEATGKLVELVKIAHRGSVRMVPEFSHFGNKVWFSVYWRYHDWFKGKIEPKQLALLDEILPQSHLILEGFESFPFTIEGVQINSLDELINLSDEVRDLLVLKVTGANDQAARSIGVLIGHSLESDLWQTYIHERLEEGNPFIVQTKVDTAIEPLPVYNTQLGRGEVFKARFLFRPWRVFGKPLSAHCTAVPARFFKTHGMTEMSISPVEFK